MRDTAWNGRGEWVGDGYSPGPMPWPNVRCQCQSERPVCGVFRCSKCKRHMPWCYGGCDTLCDFCWRCDEATP